MERWQNDRWFVSPWNYEKEVMSGNRFPEKTVIHDVTLRDGEQQAGMVLTCDDKIRIAEKLAAAGVDRIEAGMPLVSPDDEKAIREIVKHKFGCKIFGFSRCIVDDVYRNADCGVDGIVLEIPSSSHIIEKAYLWKAETAVEKAIKATLAAKDAGLYTAFFTIDASRADINWLIKLLQRVAAEGHMDSIVLVDTMGVLSPRAVAFFVGKMQAAFPGIPLEAHFHNDFGLALINTIEALRLGVPVAHVSVCSIGERSGGAALEELAVALPALYGADTSIALDKLYDLCKTVVDLGGHRLPTNKALVGDLLYSIESGIPATWWIRCKDTAPTEVFPILPTVTGHREPEIVLGKGSGEDSVRVWLKNINEAVEDGKIPDLLMRVKMASLRKKGLLNEKEFKDVVNAAKEDWSDSQ